MNEPLYLPLLGGRIALYLGDIMLEQKPYCEARTQLVEDIADFNARLPSPLPFEEYQSLLNAANKVAGQIKRIRRGGAKAVLIVPDNERRPTPYCIPALDEAAAALDAESVRLRDKIVAAQVAAMTSVERAIDWLAMKLRQDTTARHADYRDDCIRLFQISFNDYRHRTWAPARKRAGLGKAKPGPRRKG